MHSVQDNIDNCLDFKRHIFKLKVDHKVFKIHQSVKTWIGSAKSSSKLALTLENPVTSFHSYKKRTVTIILIHISL